MEERSSSGSSSMSPTSAHSPCGCALPRLSLCGESHEGSSYDYWSPCCSCSGSSRSSSPCGSLRLQLRYNPLLHHRPLSRRRLSPSREVGRCAKKVFFHC